VTEAAALDARGLRKSFGGVRAVDDVNLRLAHGEIGALIGPNGAGKTTLFNILTGHLRPDAGEVRWKDKPLSGLAPHRIWRRGVSRTFQITATFLSLSALDNVRVALVSRAHRTYSLLSRAERFQTERAQALLGLVGLADHAVRPASTLPYGDLKRLELALALANDPELLLLDEPTAGMAPAERRALIDLLERIARARRLTVLFTEHDMDVVFQVADRILVLHQGRVIADGQPAEVRADALVQRVYLGEGE
jgi:branched-chain amino acid transport system ATP-binding protein